MLQRIALLILVLAGLALAPGVGVAQGGSNYSIFGYGDILEHSSTVFTGLGGTSIAVTSPYAINVANPAAFSSVRTTRLQGSYLFRQSLNDDGSSTVAQNNGKLQGIGAHFAIDTSLGASFGFGLRPYSSVNYLFRSSFEQQLDGVTVNTITDYRGKGGLSVLYFGGSYEVMEHVILGLTANYYFGTITSFDSTYYSNSSFRDSYVRIEDNFKGAGIRLGALFEVTDKLTLGAVATLNGDLEVNRETEFSVLSDSSFVDAPLADLPLSLGLGASYASGEFVWSADILSMDFSSLEYRDGGQASYRRSNRYSLGMQWLQTTNKLKQFRDHWVWNFGLGYHEQYYQVNGNGIDEMYASIGLQLPVTDRAMLDASLTVGTRGSTDNGLIQESFFRAAFALSMGDTWFKPFRGR